ncbi:hypothetical protein [Paenibacillus radicis (ex Xue et al. 2023)]|uniref:Uncharacterized protein n=1 Tax=Paenibacillus radicis (ex Xue et al. 2023) TaxID=2972489 RepID=A0ABT1YEU1_9BACL|nr:hypothetical protein [Paenibacillus radicis (ex Xue et al. 2023)]MCR8631720.1 hypothetical protein [Paenibacillus radicis (ex Xue et al. 2023)]
MSTTKRVWQKQLEHWKHKANHLISGTEEIDERIELSPVMLEKCKVLAEDKQTTVDDVVQQILEQYWLQRTNELSTPISREHIDRNPIFLLDALAHRNFKPFGVGENNYE